jgi:signal transduction histidine kinase
MIWMVDMDGPLEDFRGDQAQQVLRISQECVANIMRHAHASVVEVRCHYVPESDSMLLEVRDNGRGIPSREAGRPLGKGLESMRLRALKLGGHLEIATKARVGTRMRLQVPLHAPPTHLVDRRVFADSKD